MSFEREAGGDCCLALTGGRAARASGRVIVKCVKMTRIMNIIRKPALSPLSLLSPTLLLLALLCLSARCIWRRQSPYFHKSFTTPATMGWKQGAPVTPECMFKWIDVAQNFVVQSQHTHRIMPRYSDYKCSTISGMAPPPRTRPTYARVRPPPLSGPMHAARSGGSTMVLARPGAPQDKAGKGRTEGKLWSKLE